MRTSAAMRSCENRTAVCAGRPFPRICQNFDKQERASDAIRRIVDTSQDPVPFMAAAAELLRTERSAELTRASPRELLNVFQVDEIGCHIITVTQVDSL